MNRLATGGLLCAALAILSGAAPTLAQTASQSAYIAPPATLRAEGIPPIPASLAAKIALYTEFRPRGVAGWHPVNREMLVATRAKNTTQLHRLTEANGKLAQITDYADPVRGGSFEPNRGAYIVYAKDTGGSEATQLYRLDADGKSTLLTDPSLLHRAGEWNHAGDRMVTASTQLDKTGRREHVTSDVAILDPLNPSATQKVASLPGAWGDFRFSQDDKRLLAQRFFRAPRPSCGKSSSRPARRNDSCPLRETANRVTTTRVTPSMERASCSRRTPTANSASSSVTIWRRVRFGR